MTTLRQKMVKLVYPFVFFIEKFGNKGKILTNTENKKSISSFYTLSVIANNEKEIFMSDFKGKKVIIVNVASDCGYAAQYDDLQQLYKANKDKLIILGFPANDFKNQEPGTDREIEQFCRMNYGITFPLFKKQTTLKPNQGPLFQWLSDESKNGWNNQQPVWNFCKYVVDESGELVGFYGTAVSPLGVEVMEGLKLK